MTKTKTTKTAPRRGGRRPTVSLREMIDAYCVRERLTFAGAAYTMEVSDGHLYALCRGARASVRPQTLARIAEELGELPETVRQAIADAHAARRAARQGGA